MSLNIYSDKSKVNSGFKIVHDVEAEFEYAQLEDNERIRQLLEKIEKSQYCSTVAYVDNMGYKRQKHQLSIGCKIAILASLLPNCVIDMVECRTIDRANIIAYCQSGNVLDTHKKQGYRDIGIKEINVVYDGMKFDTLSQLNNHTRRKYSKTVSDAITIDSDPRVVINLTPGIYMTGEVSGTNKQYLYNLFRRLGKEELAVGAFSYEDTVIGSVDSMLGKGYKVLLFNRADMYLDETSLQLIKNHSAASVILLDYKGEELPMDGFKSVDVFTCKDRIEVGLCYT